MREGCPRPSEGRSQRQSLSSLQPESPPPADIAAHTPLCLSPPRGTRAHALPFPWLCVIPKTPERTRSAPRGSAESHGLLMPPGSAPQRNSPPLRPVGGGWSPVRGDPAIEGNRSHPGISSSPRGSFVARSPDLGGRPVAGSWTALSATSGTARS